MYRSSALIITALLAISIVAGCSGDDPVTPPSPLDNAMRFGGVKSIGPSSIVFCFDVSDTMSLEELTSVVGAAGACVSDENLVPQDGSIQVAALVYGDTVGAAIDTLVAVTPESLTEIILPAFQGLLTDRIITGVGTDLDGALNAAHNRLAASVVTDLHVLVMGTGVADNPTAVQTTSQALGGDGIMISTVAYGGDEAGASLLEFSAMATGGYFGAGGDDLSGVCATALAYMLQVDLTAMPETMELARGEEHTIQAMFFRGGDADAFPMVAGDVTFEIIEGPNATEAVVVTTDTLGVAEYSYSGLNGPGTDVIVASAMHPGTGMALTDTVTATWMNTAPTCDAGGEYMATVDADTVWVMLDASGSSDADGDTLTFAWSIETEGATLDDAASMAPVLTLTGAALCADSLVVDLSVSDGFDTSDCMAVVRLDDQRAPVVEVTDEPYEIWPPNHKYVHLSADMFISNVEDACGRPLDLADVEVLAVRSDEPEDHKGDGRTVKDIVIDCDGGVMVRAERMGGGDGRMYEITYRITGDNGMSTDVTGWAYVPHDMSGGMPGDDGDAGYTVESDCHEEE